MLLDGVMLLWFILVGLSLLFVVIDIRSTPASPVLKWGFILLTAYMGPVGVFLYVLGCREPLKGTHEAYTAARWRQVLGSTMHCVAGDGVGILAGAVLASYLALSRPADIALEYVLGFGFGWTIFQALFMRDMIGGSYLTSLRKTFLAEFLSMNTLMAAMLPVATFGRLVVGTILTPRMPEFWFVMSMALLAGFIAAYPMNWWLVARGLKHGMLTVQPLSRATPKAETMQTSEPTPMKMTMPGNSERGSPQISGSAIIRTTLLSVCLLVIGVALALSSSRFLSKISLGFGHSTVIQPWAALLGARAAPLRLQDGNKRSR
ncbi:MAG: DUF4396 domain-containing protein [Candidatus Eremiobacteraeota bacterium]|nr:DUF4396 domain-containing protein [Candidatus Eremiobacteraeota bacterium]